jgi:hypothetical protein
LYYCFLCDRPAKYRVPIYVKDKYGFLKAAASLSLDVCSDCQRRVEQVEFDEKSKVHVVTMRSLT